MNSGQKYRELVALLRKQGLMLCDDPWAFPVQELLLRHQSSQPSDGALTNEGVEPVCPTCNGTKMVDDGELTHSSGGIPYECGPIKCVKDCPDCKAATCTCPSGDGSLRWPCPVHPPEVKASVSFADGIEAAAKLIERRMDEYVNEHGSYDHDTGHTEFPGNGEETVEEWMNLAESIRAIKQ